MSAVELASLFVVYGDLLTALTVSKGDEMVKERYVTYDEFQEFKRTDIQEMKDDIRDLQKNVSEISKDVGHLSGKIDVLTARFDDFTKSITWYKYVFLVAVLAPVAERIFNHLF